MALSNAERQARYKKRLKDQAAASSEKLGELARDAIDQAIKAIWENRQSNDASWDDVESLDHFPNVLRFPLRKRRVIGNKIITDFRACSSRISRHYAFYECLVSRTKIRKSCEILDSDRSGYFLRKISLARSFIIQLVNESNI